MQGDEPSSRPETPRPKRQAFLAVAATIVSLLVTELLLRAFVPFNISTIGRRDSANAAYYGWGYDPHEEIRLRDPDSLETFSDRANNHGWRDRDRRVENSGGSFRILALGDSNTFGAIVRRPDMWTSVLEQRLRSEGLDAEVINMSYSGWGTDQELEALKREGQYYKPDLLILQFTSNDLEDNRYYLSDPGLKPFYYTLDDGGALQRHANGDFSVIAQAVGWRGYARAVIQRSEILKRLFVAYQAARFLARPAYLVTPLRLRQIKTVFGADSSAPVRELEPWLGKAIPEATATAIARRTVGADDAEALLRMLENRALNRYWIPMQYRPPAADPRSEPWRLYFALVEAVNDVARSVGARTVILSDVDEGFLRWERYWFRVCPEPQCGRSYLSPNRVIGEFADRHGMALIANSKVVTRARNDSHPDAEGNRAIAANIYDYLAGSGLLPQR